MTAADFARFLVLAEKGRPRPPVAPNLPTTLEDVVASIQSLRTLLAAQS
jgi:hypothetical protein